MIWVWIIVICVLGIIGARMMQGKNRDPWQGALLGGLLGLIGLLIIACLRKQPENV